MPILICDNHLLDNLLNVLIRKFNNPIHLWSVGRRIMMCNLGVFAKNFHPIVIQVWSIGSNDLTWHTIMAYDLILDKPYNNLLGYICIRCRFNPFCEVVNCHQNETMSIRSFGLNHANHINSPHGEGPRRGNGIQQCQRNMNLISINLTLVAFLHKLATIRFHCQPIVTCSQHLLCHCMSIGMSTKGTFVQFGHQQVCFVVYPCI